MEPQLSRWTNPEYSGRWLQYSSSPVYHAVAVNYS